MRSRYSAFALGLSEYLLATWHADTRPPSLALDGHLKWLGLEVRSQHESGARAIVEFVARSKPAAGRAIRLHETSRFVREGGRWYYLDAGPGR
jgi:SEC-C motif-containing protein